MLSSRSMHREVCNAQTYCQQRHVPVRVSLGLPDGRELRRLQRRTAACRRYTAAGTGFILLRELTPSAASRQVLDKDLAERSRKVIANIDEALLYRPEGLLILH